ncbi:MAG TPA: L,D-transpeptidase family protein [Pseudomonadales bacterium]|nr:L,D-transpeptidase family protein [Pseudomonadales bacterium]
MTLHRVAVAAALLFTIASRAQAAIFALPPDGESLIGREERIIAGREDTLIEIGRQNDIGYDEITNANPGVDPWMPHSGSTVTLPHLYLLPDAPRQGIVINTAEMRLYFYPKTPAGKTATVESFPISIGRSDWNTPLVTTKITRKVSGPVWYPTASVKKEHLENGDPLPSVVPAGPDNPLGKYALYLSIPAYLIHGTNNEYGIGMQVTHGCMRMYAPDIKRLFETVPVGTSVRIVNQPYKVGWKEGVLYVEVHPWLEGTPEAQRNDTAMLTRLVRSQLKEYIDYPVDWQAVEQARIEATGLPIPVGPTVTPIASTQ